MATTLTLVNKVLRGLRQFGLILADGTTSMSDDYLLLILQFINEAKEEIEESGWSWQALRRTVTVTLSSGVATVDLLSASEADVDTNDRTRLLYETTMEGSISFYSSSSSRPLIFDVTTSAEGRLTERTQEQMERLHFVDDDETGAPQFFALWNDGDSIKLKVWPTPNATYTLKLRMFIPQAELSATTLTATTLSLPQRPVWLLALFKANQERGEELGKEGSALHRAYLDAHGAAVGKEQTQADQTVFLER